jgi:hypothetical protein
MVLLSFYFMVCLGLVSPGASFQTSHFHRDCDLSRLIGRDMVDLTPIPVALFSTGPMM